MYNCFAQQLTKSLFGRLEQLGHPSILFREQHRMVQGIARFSVEATPSAFNPMLTRFLGATRGSHLRHRGQPSRRCRVRADACARLLGSVERGPPWPLD